MREFLSALGVLALAASASAATLKVPQQYETIQEAVNAAADGDTIVVARGVYFESIGVGTPNLRILGKKAVVDGSFNGIGLTVQATGYYTCMSIYAPGVTVQGFTFRNGANHVDVYAPECSILKCISLNAGNTGFFVPGYDGFLVSGNRVIGAGNNGIYAAGSSGGGVVSKNQVRQAGNVGIYAGGGSGTVVERNTVGAVYGGSGIFSSGSGAVLISNRVSNTGGDGIRAFGQGTRVEGNRVGWAVESTGIYLDGGGSVVAKNFVTGARDLFQVYGSGNRIVDNRGFGGGNGAGFYIGGDSITVTGNLAQQIADYGSGFYIYSYSTAGGGTIEGNTAEDAAYAGFFFSSIYNGTVRDCVAIRCGFRGSTAGFFIYGSGTTFEDCSAVECHGDGFTIGGNTMTFTGCSATGALINGFQVLGGGNTFNDCGSRGSGGQGFHNRAQGTILSGGTYRANRIDIANNSDNAATFSGGLAGVIFDTGGETTEPDVFWYDN